MWYMPFVRVRRAVIIYAIFALALTLVAVAIRFWPGAVKYDVQTQMQLAQMHVDLMMLCSGAAAAVAGLATVLGLNLAAENDGHLELAWTKPVSREGYALGVFAVDLGAMAVCLLLTLLCAGLITDLYIGHQALDAPEGATFVRAFANCGFPLCVYAWIAALSASLKRNRGAVAGLFWPLMLALGILTIVPVPAIHAVVALLNTVNPVVIFTDGSGGQQPSTATYFSGWAIAAALLAVALAQWRRLEI